jgi:hypothetical protein
MFNPPVPLRRRSGGPPLNPGLSEHTPKKRRTKEPVLFTEGHQFDPNLGSRLEQADDDRHRQIMSAQASLKERIENKSAKSSGDQEGNKGSANEESAKGAGNEESTKGAGYEESAKDVSKEESAKGTANNEIDKGATPDREEPITSKSDKDHSQESSSSASIADKKAKAMTDLMWQEHPSMQAQKSAKTVFFEENAKGSLSKWGDQEEEDMQSAPLWNYNATTEENASSSAAMSAEKSKNGSLSGKDEKDPNSAESQMQKEADRKCRKKLIALMRPQRLRRNLKYFSRISCKKGNTHSCPRPPTLLSVRILPHLLEKSQKVKLCRLIHKGIT